MFLKKKKEMGFCSFLTYISSSASRMFDFYCFMKEFHDEIDCNMRINCRLLNFFLLIDSEFFATGLPEKMMHF